MMYVDIIQKDLLASKGKVLGVFVEYEKTLEGTVAEIAQQHIPALQQLMVDSNFTGKAGEKLIVPFMTEAGVRYLILVGLGARNQGVWDIETYRRAVGSVVRELPHLKSDTLALVLPSAESFACTDEYLAQQTVIIADMAYYHFDKFITEASRKYPKDLALTLVVHNHQQAGIEDGVHSGKICARGIYETRYWVDMPPDHSTPFDFARRAKEIAESHKFKISIFNEAEVNQMGMGGLGAVARGSERDCQFVVLEYTCKKAGAPTLGFVGKGITFDAGGLSLKPADYMETMKEDMSGAAAVLGAMDALGSLAPEVNIVAVVPLAENLPSGKAIKPGDIVTFYNGKTAEILNTDAEGRLILADALAYAVKHYKLDALIDLATLTGACPVALGHFFTALLSEHEDLVKRVQESATRSGDRVWRLPLVDDFKPAIKSEYADMKNIGSRRYSAGTITATCFLQNFVGDVPWVHLDIAGTAFDVPDISYYRGGATGVGVRLLIDLAMNWK